MDAMGILMDWRWRLSRLRRPASLLPLPLRWGIDDTSGRVIKGWVIDPRRPDHQLDVALYEGERCVATAPANRFRADLAAAGIGSGACGFEFENPLWGSPAGVASMRLVALGDRVVTMTRFGPLTRLPRHLTADVARLAGSIVAGAPAPTPMAARAAEAHRLLLDDAENALSPYAEFIRLTRCGDAIGPASERASNLDRFYAWYLSVHAASRAPLRIPLAAREIDHLNEPMYFGGHEFPISRATAFFMPESARSRSLFNLSTPDAYRNLLMWWCLEKAPELNAQDCLIPDYYTRFLSAEHRPEPNRAFPLTRFLHAFAGAHDRLQLPREDRGDDGPFLIYLHAIMEAVLRPHLFGFIPDRGLDATLARLRSSPDFLASIKQDTVGALPSVSAMLADRSSLEAALRARGYDLAQRRHLTIDAWGNRAEAARLGAPVADDPVDIQIFGPFNRASGLGKYVRATRRALEGRGYTLNCVNYDDGNPQPIRAEGNDSLGAPRAARLNIIQVNPDFLPNLFAYLPDVFTGARNVGVFAWELNKPAAGDALAFKCVDEIWVATEFCREVFAQSGKPTHNIGYAFEPFDTPDRAIARAALLRKLKATDDSFIFLTMFDSLSWVERKNPMGLVRAFQKAFADEPRARLVVKSHNTALATTQAERDYWSAIREAFDRDPRICLIDATLSEVEMAMLLAGADCLVSLHRSEGIGLGMLEAMYTGVPVVATAYSGNVGFCARETCWLVDYDLVPVARGEYAYAAPGHVWAEPRLDSAVAALRDVMASPERRAARTKAARDLVVGKYGIENVAERHLEAVVRALSAARGDGGAKN